MKRHLRDLDAVTWDGFLWMWGRVGDHASGEHDRRIREIAKFGKWRFA